jgi:hypothetical protein
VHYMVIEHFKSGPEPVYRRFREHGRMAPEGLAYLSSWVDHELNRCFQLMETANPALITQWTANWNDIVEFEIIPVMSSSEAAEAVARGAAHSVGSE